METTEKAPLEPNPFDRAGLEHSVITDKDKESFFKAFMADTPYTELVRLFDDKVATVFRTMTVEENDDVMQQISLDIEHGIAKNTDNYVILIASYRLGLSLISINEKVIAPEITKSSFKTDKEKGVTYVAERAKIIRNWPAFKMAAFASAFRQFENKVLKLTSAVQEPNFWKAAA